MHPRLIPPSTPYEGLHNQGHGRIAWISLGATQACRKGKKRPQPRQAVRVLRRSFSSTVRRVDGREQTYGGDDDEDDDDCQKGAPVVLVL